MKILFANLPWWEVNHDSFRQGIRAGSRWPFTKGPHHHPDEWRAGGYMPFPFFMASAAAYLKAKWPAWEIVLRDSIARGESYEVFVNAFQNDTPDWLVIETATPSWKHDADFCAAIHGMFPGVKIVITGTLVASCGFRLPDWAFAAVKGEYEKGVNHVIETQTRGIIDHMLLSREELDNLPFPMFDGTTTPYHYHDACPVYKDGSDDQFPHLQIWTSRGCPFKCVFCGWPATMTGNDPDGDRPRSVRQHSPEWVEAMLVDRLRRATLAGMPYRSIYIDDDTFNLTDKHALAISAVMKKIGLPWSAMCRADTCNPETWAVMRDSGCFGVKIGCESGSQRVVTEIVNKRLNLGDVENKWLPLLKELGFNVHTTWTVGLPGETQAEAEETVAMIRRLYEKGLHRTHQLSGTAEIEGTPLATLRHAGEGAELSKYPGAHVDANYSPSNDGQKKIERLTRPALA